MAERNWKSRRALGWLAAIGGVALVACAGATGRGASVLLPLAAATKAPQHDLTMTVVFEPTRGCPTAVNPDPAYACTDTSGNPRPNCGRASHTKTVTFQGAEPFSVYFDPSQARIVAKPPPPVAGGAPVYTAQIGVNDEAAYIEYKFSVISGRCTDKYFDPIIIIEN